MSTQKFDDYLRSTYSTRNSGAASSYINAIRILDELLHQQNLFQLEEQSIADIRDAYKIEKIIDFIVQEEDKYRNKQTSLFDQINPNQTSYPRKRFCTAAVRRLGEFINHNLGVEATEIMSKSFQNGKSLSSKLQRMFDINDNGTDREVRAKNRVGQNIFRAMLLNIYSYRCCLTGIDVPEVLRASHIIPWSERVNTRLNPENGLCLSATYDAAFDKHLITFDEDYRMVISPVLKEAYTSQAFKRHFLNYEGKTIEHPTKYAPSLEFLEYHREKLIS